MIAPKVTYIAPKVTMKKHVPKKENIQIEDEMKSGSASKTGSDSGSSSKAASKTSSPVKSTAKSAASSPKSSSP